MHSFAARLARFIYLVKKAQHWCLILPQVRNLREDGSLYAKFIFKRDR